MTEPSSSSSLSAPDSTLTTTAITNLDDDSLTKCASYLSLQDVSHLAMTCKLFKRVAYSDAVWHRLYRETWPQSIEQGFQLSAIRKTYLDRLSAIRKFKFANPQILDFYPGRRPVSHILLQKDRIILSQGSLVKVLSLDRSSEIVALSRHNARVTCMRLFPLREAHTSQNETHTSKHVLATSSCDHSIRLWLKNSCHRCFRGHTGPVSILSDKLLGDGYAGVFASGGEDGTVRLWSLNSTGGKGQQALKATLHGHEKPVKLMSVARHKTSLLISIANDSKVRVWDSTAASCSCSSCYVGMSSVPGAPVGMKCHDSCVYIAAGSCVQAIDLRTMKKAFTAVNCGTKVHSFDMLPSKFLVCTGVKDRVLIWDVRKNKDILAPEDSLAELDGHNGPVTLIHMDAHKVVTGGPSDLYNHIWDSETFCKISSLICCNLERSWDGCSAMAVDGGRIATATTFEGEAMVRYRNFTHATCSVSSDEDEHGSKFWCGGKPSSSCSDSDYGQE